MNCSYRLFLWWALCLVACSKAKAPEPLPVVENPVLKPFIPANFPPTVYDLTQKPVTQKGFELGKGLFYETLLSRDNSVSCGSCHIQSSSFTHHGHDLSHGIDNQLGRRNALPVYNVLWRKSFFWDGGVFHLDLVPLNAIQNKVEMDEKVESIIAKLQTSPYYQNAFQEAFGQGPITSEHFLNALSQFMAMMVSANSRYDHYIRQEGVALTEQELAGLQLFKQKCASCHATDLFTDQSFRNNGVAVNLQFDKGRGEVTLNPEDEGKFLVPSLRNIELTAPYMHNGQLTTLQQVLNHYSAGVKDNPALDPLLKNGEALGIPLSEQEKNQIISFLRTLTDPAFISDTRFSE